MIRKPLALAMLACAATLGPTVANAAIADAAPPALRTAVLADAARRTGLTPEQMKLVTAELVTWPDASLGCPKPGMAYTQALVRGWRLLVEAGDTSMRYHANLAGSRWLHCDADRAQEPAPVDPRS